MAQNLRQQPRPGGNAQATGRQPAQYGQSAYTDRIPEAGRLELRGNTSTGARLDLSRVLWARIIPKY